jgi:hypothetical protein
MKIYEIKKLIDGYKVSRELSGKILVACKAVRGYTHIRYNNDIMTLPAEPLCALPHQDNYGRGVYFLNYYEWKPVAKESLWSIK